MILFVAHDAGPAKYMAYLMQKFDQKEYLCLASTIAANVFDQFAVLCYADEENVNLDSVDLIVTGTCLDACLDKKWTAEGKRRGILTVSIIEHWSLYRRRFKLEGHDLFPDVIFVNDNYAKEEAVKEGIDAARVVVAGNPVLENIKGTAFSAVEKKEWMQNLQIASDQKIITFVSESLRADFPESSLEYPGFDEFSVLEDILGLLPEQTTLLIKLHPVETKDKYAYLDAYENVTVVQETPIDKLIMFSDILLGMGSMLLLEASLMRSNVYAYRPNERMEFIGNRLHMTKGIFSRYELGQLFSGGVTNRGSRVKNRTHSNVFAGSTEKIITLLRGITK